MLRMNRAANTGHSQRLWPVFALLAAVVALPTAGVLWFMNEAMRNEQLAVRQRLMDLYRSQLLSAAGQIQESWANKLSGIQRIKSRKSTPEAFFSIVNEGYADSVLFYTRGSLVYPESAALSRISAEPATPQWLEARRLEYNLNSFQAAADLYQQIAEHNPKDAATALTAEARCLNKAGRIQDAISILVNIANNARLRDAHDVQGRLITPSSLLFALQLMKEPAHPLFAKNAMLLVELLNDYRIPMPPSQRRFIASQLLLLWPDCPQSPAMKAEELAAGFAASKPALPAPGRLQPAAIPGIWIFLTPDSTTAALFDQGQLLRFLKAAVESRRAAGIRYSVLAPGVSNPASLKTEIGDAFPSWQLAINLEESDPFQAASKQQVANYVWTGILVTGGIVLLSLLMAAFLRKQVRLTRLKNDLIATVSHELKTPLASMRLLVDTLNNGQSQDTRLVQDYLQLISKENARLSNLIEEFLTFSRMERNKAKFEHEPVNPQEIVRSALETLGSRLQDSGCRLQVELADPMPEIIGDREALITVLVNLLDNALKYTGEQKEIALRGFSANGSVWIEVQDNGIGFPRSAAKKIFDRFYQVDRTLSRRTGGCGLGLSIVRFIVAAHNGSVAVKSQLGKGSTFTVQLPAL
jgi:signal transduction histidine kinase